jgi:pyruvate/2-oxoacid:ferredoxin oxidoreductase alpha subunit
MVLFGRNSESPVPVIAASTPAQCFDAAIEAARIALKYRTPVYLLSDAYLANGSEPWLLPDVDSLPDISVEFAEADGDKFMPYARDQETLARPWAIPGTAGLEHRIGGLEKQDVTGNVSYDPERRRSPGSRRTSPSSRSTTTRARNCSCSVGAGRSDRSPRRCGAYVARAGPSRRRTSTT